MSQTQADEKCALPNKGLRLEIDPTEWKLLLEANKAQEAQEGRFFGRGLPKSCSWCTPVVTPPLPTTFCWSKMQAESGQGIEQIIRRKDLERINGNGLFYWGIGNDIRPSISELCSRTSSPEIFFSEMLSKPKNLDSAPASVLLWTEYFDKDGSLRPLPAHALVISNAHTVSGAPKRSYYALVCHSDKPLVCHNIHLNIGHCCNLTGKKGKIGAIQVTSNIEHWPGNDPGRIYPIDMRANLTAPYFIKLSGAKVLVPQDRDEMDEIFRFRSHGPTPSGWLRYVTALRKRYNTSENPNGIL